VFATVLVGSESILYSFTGGSDGHSPWGKLIKDVQGNLYGTTLYGGRADSEAGVVFKLDVNGTLTVLHAFSGLADGGSPLAGLVKDEAGNLYGTNTQGGDFSCQLPYGCGVVFKIDNTGVFSVLHTFHGTDGASPAASLVRDNAGNLYGTTVTGGDLSCFPYGYGCGVVFKVDTGGNETVLHSFGGADGALPYASLLRDAAGNLYGTTSMGGDLNCSPPFGCGTVFRIPPK
jgi:uncharacterized repeat protein (TIGR03803 family)